MTALTPFHLAIPVRDVEEAEDFYVRVLGCEVGRKDKTWVDLNLFGHQLVCHQVDYSNSYSNPNSNSYSNPVDGDHVPVPHFGVVLTMNIWRRLAERLTEQKVRFEIEPRIRFEGEVGEQATMFFKDPSDNALEFKAFHDIDTELFKAN